MFSGGFVVQGASHVQLVDPELKPTRLALQDLRVPERIGQQSFSALSTSRAEHLMAAGAARPEALTSGLQRALVACSIFLLAAAAAATRATNTRGEPAATVEPVPVPEPS